MKQNKVNRRRAWTIFAKQETPTLVTLEHENAELIHEMALLSAKARSTTYLPDKEEILRQKGKLYRKSQELQGKIEALKEAQALVTTQNLIIKNLNDIRLYVNNQKVQIPQDLNSFELRFSCGHTVKMPFYDIIRYQTTLKSNRALLAHWTSIIHNAETRTRQPLCPQCMRERRDYLLKHHIERNKPTGVALIKIMVIP